MTLKFKSHTLAQVVSIIILIIAHDRHADLSTGSPAMLATPRLKIMQLIGISYPGYDVNIVLRVHETDCTDGVQSARKENNKTAGAVG
jgi:hypothetical protein